MALCPAPITAPFELREVTNPSDLREGETYFVLRHESGQERAHVAVFLYDPIGVRPQLVARGYVVDWDYVTAKRTA